MKVMLTKFEFDCSFVVIRIVFITFGWGKLRLETETKDSAIFEFIKRHNSRKIKVKLLKFKRSVFSGTWIMHCVQVSILLVEGKLELENGN